MYRVKLGTGVIKIQLSAAELHHVPLISAARLINYQIYISVQKMCNRLTQTPQFPFD